MVFATSYFVCYPSEKYYNFEIRKLEDLGRVLVSNIRRPELIQDVIERYGIVIRNESTTIESMPPDGPYDPWEEIHIFFTWIEISEDVYNRILGLDSEAIQNFDEIFKTNYSHD